MRSRGQKVSDLPPQEVVAKHQSKVYGKAAIGAPPMSVLLSAFVDPWVLNGTLDS